MSLSENKDDCDKLCSGVQTIRAYLANWCTVRITMIHGHSAHRNGEMLPYIISKSNRVDFGIDTAV